MRRLLEELPSVRMVHDSGGNFLLVELAGEDPGIASRLRRDLLASSRIEVKDISGSTGPAAATAPGRADAGGQ